LKIVVGTDGSAHAQRAVDWCARHAPALGAEVIVVHAFEPPTYDSAAMRYFFPIPLFSEDDRQRLRDRVEQEWCGPLAEVSHRVVVVDGDAAMAIRHTTEAEGADLVVTGRRGLGVVDEHLLGSTSYKLMHHLGCPLIIVP
jgi:nucleotide-binding universal stress UspA family protein